MKFFRLHSVRIGLLVLLVVSILPSLWPWQQDSHDKALFSQWLGSLIDHKESEEAGDKLDRLHEDTSDVVSLLKQASLVISENRDLFSLPVDEQNASQEDVFRMLIKQWSLHHQGSGMSETTLLERILFKVPGIEKAFKHFMMPWHQTLRSERSQESHLPIFDLPFKPVSLIPMANGVAIGAP